MKSQYCKLLDEPNENDKELQGLYSDLRVMDKLRKVDQKIKTTTLGRKETIVKGRTKPCPPGKENNVGNGICRVRCMNDQERLTQQPKRCVKKK